MHLTIDQIDMYLTMFLKVLPVPVIIAVFKKWGQYLKHKKQTEADEFKKLHHKDDLLQAGVIALLHNKIYANCTLYLENGYITPDQKDDLDYLFGGYHGLGGNSTGEWLYKRASELPIKER